MNKITQIFITSLIILFYSSSIYGQKRTLDSIYIVIDNKTELNLAIYNYKNLVDNIRTDYTKFLSILSENNDIPDDIFYSIDYNPNKTLSIKQTKGGERIIWENNTQKKFQFNNQCNIRSEDYYLQIKFNDLQALMSDSLLIRLLEAIDKIDETNGRLSKTYAYTFQGNQLIKDEQLDNRTKSLDILFLKGGLGVNLIKSELIIDISAEIGFGIARKGILKNQYYVSYNLLFDFMEESKTNLNGFLNVGYRHNLSNKIDRPNWLGVELGYLINNQGDLFEKNTFKFSVDWELGKYVSVSPQLYLSNDGKDFYPALRLGFGF
ncbi:MAG: hypothetical protein QM503_14520 [Bacteroidota bacterium]